MIAKVTALVFAHNNENEIIRCLESISTQSCAEKIHVVLHDDASEDSTAAIAKDFLRASGLSWEIITNTENQYSNGIDFFRRVMVSCKTPYVALCDADDFWVTRSKIELQLREMDADSNLVLTHHAFELVDSNSGLAFGISNNVDPNPENSRTAFLRSNYVGACTAMYRTSVLNSILNWKGFGALPVPDYPFWGMLSMYGNVKWMEGIVSAYSVSNSSMSSKLKYSGLDRTESEVRRWLWCLYASSGKFDAQQLEEAWKSLILDWQALPAHRLPAVSFASRIILRGIIRHTPFQRLWKLQILLGKVRANWFPIRRN